jgi:hypothetical protein
MVAFFALGPDLTTATIGMADSDLWWAGLPLWIWIGAASYLSISLLARIARGDIAKASARTH